MKIDVVSIYNLVILLVCITLMFSYIVLSCRSAIKRASTRNAGYTENQVRKYFLKLTVKDYNAFEKYGIWRYTILF
jgi:hypothetical protein